MSSQRLPSYADLQTPDQSNVPVSFMRGPRAGRCVTITLQEIRFPVGCPCHPVDPEGLKKADKKKQKQPLTFEPMFASSWVPHSRPALVEIAS